jgi:hypothetical protein
MANIISLIAIIDIRTRFFGGIPYNHRTDKEDALRRIKNAMPPLNELDKNFRSKYVNTLKFIETAIDYNMLSV